MFVSGVTCRNSLRILSPHFMFENSCAFHSFLKYRHLCSLIGHNQESLILRTSCAASPHPQKVKKGIKARVMPRFGHAGDDAYCFLSHKVINSSSKNTYSIMGVADGVASWRDRGINASDFSQGLVKSLADLSQSVPLTDTSNYSDSDSSKAIREKHLMSLAFENVLSSGMCGSATFCVLALDSRFSVLRSATLGDSGFFVCREKNNGESVIYKTVAQEHAFGYPFQLGHHANSDHPNDADTAEVDVEIGDLILLATDGLWDNLSETEILFHVKQARLRCKATESMKRMDLGELAQNILRDAYDASIDRRRCTPYSISSSKEFDMVYTGGNPDDITILVAVVESEKENK